MRIGVLSDTHGGYRDFLTALEKMGEVDCYIHMGDVLYNGYGNAWPSVYDSKALAEHLKQMDNIYFVRGNCDSDYDEEIMGKNLSEKFRIMDFDGVRIYFTHGHRESEEERIKMAEEKFCDFLITGHTHVKVNNKTETVHILNPGSTTIPRDGSNSCMVIDGYDVEVYEW